MESANQNAQVISVSFDNRVFSTMAVKKAAYRYIASFGAEISINGHVITCLCTFPSPSNHESCGRTINEFRKEVLDQDLRETLKAETEAVRNLILAHAFSKTGIISDEPVQGP